MAGNIREWTMEVYNCDSRVVRGGSYDDDGRYTPVSIRFHTNPNYCPGLNGFRIALYISL